MLKLEETEIVKIKLQQLKKEINYSLIKGDRNKGAILSYVQHTPASRIAVHVSGQPSKRRL